MERLNKLMRKPQRSIIETKLIGLGVGTSRDIKDLLILNPFQEDFLGSSFKKFQQNGGEFKSPQEYLDYLFDRAKDTFRNNLQRVRILARIRRGKEIIPVGYISIDISPNKPPHVKNVFVLPEYEERGLGSKLEKKAYYLARMLGEKTITGDTKPTSKRGKFVTAKREELIRRFMDKSLKLPSIEKFAEEQQKRQRIDRIRRERSK